jgi:hypothetical protein
MGWSALSGVVIVLLAYVFNYPLAKYNIYVGGKSGLLTVFLRIPVTDNKAKLEGERCSDEHCERASSEHSLPQVLRLG